MDDRDIKTLVRQEVRYVRSHRAPGSDIGYAIVGFALMTMTIAVAVMIGAMIR